VKELLRSHSLSYVQGLQVALEAQGIETALFDQQTLGFMGFAGRVRLVVQRDADYERALHIIRELEPPPQTGHGETGWNLQRWGCAAAALGVIALVFASASVTDLATGSPLPPMPGLWTGRRSGRDDRRGPPAHSVRPALGAPRPTGVRARHSALSCTVVA
jgi:putative signal transducing protein